MGLTACVINSLSEVGFYEVLSRTLMMVSTIQPNIILYGFIMLRFRVIQDLFIVLDGSTNSHPRGPRLVGCELVLPDRSLSRLEITEKNSACP